MVPKIIFRYSSIYDKKWQKLAKLRGFDLGKYPPENAIKDFLEKAKKHWKKYEKSILKQISRSSGLKWKEEKINCYIVGKCIPFSDPLTLRIHKNLDYFIDTLTHELIHQIFIQNSDLKKYRKIKNPIDSKYSRESEKTRIHVLVHAVHKDIYLKLFNRERLEHDKKKLEHKQDYKKSWEIVEKEGHKNIIKGLK